MAGEDKAQESGRKGADGGAPERYPSVRQDDAVERTGREEEVVGEGRTFDPSVTAPTPEQVTEGSPEPKQEGFEGPQGDPAEGKRR
jgi:hypothetical protein